MTVVYILIVMFLNVDSKEILLDGTRILLFLVFSILAAAANTVLSIKVFPKIAAYIIHYAVYAFAVYSCLLLPLSLEPASKNFVAIVVFTVFYLIFMGARALFKSRYKKLSEEDQAYTKRFSK